MIRMIPEEEEEVEEVEEEILEVEEEILEEEEEILEEEEEILEVIEVSVEALIFFQGVEIEITKNLNQSLSILPCQSMRNSNSMFLSLMISMSANMLKN